MSEPDDDQDGSKVWSRKVSSFSMRTLQREWLAEARLWQSKTEVGGGRGEQGEWLSPKKFYSFRLIKILRMCQSLSVIRLEFDPDDWNGLSNLEISS